MKSRAFGEGRKKYISCLKLEKLHFQVNKYIHVHHLRKVRGYKTTTLIITISLLCKSKISYSHCLFRKAKTSHMNCHQ